MKYKLNTALWRGRGGKLWRLADRLEDTAQAIRYAQKPYDLVFPTTNLIDLADQLKEMKWHWVSERIGLDKRTWARWPKV